MENPGTDHHKKRPVNNKADRTEIYIQRDFKEYLGESALIVFSVLLALFLTEFINNIHDKDQTSELLHNIKLEIIKNKHDEQDQYIYQQKVLSNIDSALKHPDFQHKVFNNGELHLALIAPYGVLYRDLSKVAWQVAQSHNITTKINFPLVEKLTDIYEQQARIDKLEDQIARILLGPGSRNDSNARETLILLRDGYKGWAVDRAPSLIKKYDGAIKILN